MINKKTHINSLSTNTNSTKTILAKNSHEKPLLSIKDLNMIFKVRGAYKKVLDDISFDVNKGDFFGIIGESGSGKTTTGKVIIKLHQASGGVIEFDGKLISQPKMSIQQKRWMHKNIQMIFQDPMSSMDPIKNVLKIVSEPLIINGIVQQDSIEFIKKINIIRKYFKYHFDKVNNDNLIAFKKDYFESLTNIYNKWNKNLKEYNIKQIDSLLSASEVVDSILSDLLDDLQINFEKTHFISKKQTDLIETNIKKYEEGKLEPIDIELYKSLHKLKQIKVLKNKTVYSIELIKKEKDLSKELKEFKNEFNKKHFQEIKNYFNVLKAKTTSNIKTSKQDKLLSSDNLLRTYYSLQELSYKEKKLILELVIKKNKYLIIDEVDQLMIEVDDYIVKKYNSLLTELLNKKNEFDKVSIKDKVVILDWLNSIKESKIKSLQEEVKEKYIEEISEFYKNLDLKYGKLSSNRFEKYEKEVLHKEKQLQEIRDLINKEDNKQSQNWQVDYDKANKEHKLIVEKRNKIINDWKESLKSQKNTFNKEKNIVKETIRKSNEAKENFKKTIIEFLDKFANEEINSKKTWWEKFKTKRYISVIRKSLNPKWKTQKTINYQYRNTMNGYRIVTWLHKSLPCFSWIWYLPILKIITRNRVYDALTSVGLKHEHAYRYPHEFSGGQRQRIVIARALITKPKLIIADEPISALDVSIQSQVINIMKKLAKEHGVTFLFIAHDLSMVSYACNKVIIMHNGKIVEKGDAVTVFKNPIHPYTKTLFNAAPELSKIHVDLASFDENMDYDKDYGPLNKPKFEKIADKADHQVFATLDQIKKWTKK